jgi:hypothetical protein
VLATLTDASFAAGLNFEELTQGIYGVIGKNNAKMTDTREVRGGESTAEACCLRPLARPRVDAALLEERT